MRSFLFIMIVVILVIVTSNSKANPYDNDFENNSSQTVSESSNVDNPKNNIKPFSITPAVSLLSFPHLFDGSIEMVFSEVFGIKYSQNLTSNSVIDNNRIHFDNKKIALRTYPGRGAWFLGLGYGHHEINVDRTDTINGFDTTTYARIKSDYLIPATGFKWVYESGFSLGVEVGWIFAMNNSTAISSDQDLNPFVTNDPDYSRRRKDAEDSINKYVNSGTISICLLEIGYTF